MVQKLDFYTPQELKVIIQRSAKVLGVKIEEEGAMELARRSRGTPRLANRLLKRVRDFAQVKYDGVITRQVADFALDILDVDRLGLDNNDRAILNTIIQKFSGGPVGLDTLGSGAGRRFWHTGRCIRAIPSDEWSDQPHAKGKNRYGGGLPASGAQQRINGKDRRVLTNE